MRIKKKDFKAWLESKDPNETLADVFYGANSCPIAKYLAEDRGMIGYFVGAIKILDPSYEESNIEVSPWMSKFVTKFDYKALDWFDEKRDDTIPVSFALDCLEKN